jgi:hypothetical protein
MLPLPLASSCSLLIVSLARLATLLRQSTFYPPTPHLLFCCLAALHLATLLPCVGWYFLPPCFARMNFELGETNILATTRKGEYFIYFSFVYFLLLSKFFF